MLCTIGLNGRGRHRSFRPKGSGHQLATPAAPLRSGAPHSTRHGPQPGRNRPPAQCLRGGSLPLGVGYSRTSWRSGPSIFRTPAGAPDMTLEELRASGKATVSVRQAAALLGVAESTAWRSIRAGDFPVRPWWIGQRCVLPSLPLIRLLEGEDISESDDSRPVPPPRVTRAQSSSA